MLIYKKKEEDNALKKIIQNFTNEFLSVETKRSYLKDLLLFFEFFKKSHIAFQHPQEVTREHSLLYRDYLIKNYAPGTVHRRLVALRSFMKWCLYLQLIDNNPLELIKLPRCEVQNPTLALSDSEVQSIFSFITFDSVKNGQQGLVLYFLLQLGLRRSELVSIKIKDFIEDKDHFLLRIYGKGGKIRFIPINNFLQSKMKQYFSLAESEKFFYSQEDYLFRTSPLVSKPIHGTTVFRIVERFVKKANISKKIGAHSCRATVISHLLDTQKINIRDVAIFAGHSNIETTQRYDKRRDSLKNSAAYSVDYSDSTE